MQWHMIFFFILGLCALSVDNDNGYIAYPGSSQVRQCNECKIFLTPQIVQLIFARHQSLLRGVGKPECGLQETRKWDSTDQPTV